MSKGHIWPEWLKPFNPSMGPDHIRYIGRRETYVAAVPGPDYAEERRQGAIASRKARVVCRSCNGGWMSVIENRAKGPALRLMFDEWHAFETPAQATIAAWLCLIVMMVEHLDPDTKAIPQSDRDWMMKHKQPPPHWRIWGARYLGAKWNEHVCRRTALQILTEDRSPHENGGGYKPNTQVTTFVLGKLCVHAFSSTEWANFEGYDGAQLQRLWPLPGFPIIWPFVPTLTDFQIVDLAESLPRSLSPHPKL